MTAAAATNRTRGRTCRMRSSRDAVPRIAERMTIGSAREVSPSKR